MPSRPTGTGVVRAINARAALRLLLDEGPLSRPQIAAALGVSKPTASHLLAQLHQSDLVRSGGSRSGTVGRAAELFGVDETAAYAAAVDVTPERIATAVVDFTGARVGAFELPAPRIPTRTPPTWSCRRCGEPAPRSASTRRGCAPSSSASRGRSTPEPIGCASPRTSRTGSAPG